MWETKFSKLSVVFETSLRMNKVVGEEVLAKYETELKFVQRQNIIDIRRALNKQRNRGGVGVDNSRGKDVKRLLVAKFTHPANRLFS